MIPIFDGHNDTLTKMYSLENGLDLFFNGTQKCDIDLPKAKQGNLIGGNFAIFVPPKQSAKESDPMYGMKFTKEGYKKKLANPIKKSYAQEYTNSILKFLKLLEDYAKGAILTINKYEDLRDCLEKEKLGVLLHFEGAEVIERDLSNLGSYYQRGLRSLGLVWSRPNLFGTGVPFEFPNTPNIGSGLSDEGKKLVKECNKLGIIIDLAHINEEGFWDVEKNSEHPLVVSHAGVHSICPSTRNLTDKQIKAIGDTNGIIGVMFESSNIRPDGRLDENTSISIIVDHIDYIIKKIGVDHVGFGSDFDGATMPNSLNNVSQLPMLIKNLKKRGYTKKSIEKIAYRNWIRVFKDTWHH
ncbi:MAG: peptidase [Candidatus Lokiarchaeota archaeon]|nr:peptidase [Candidatus Lokiarchaeota archaeon]